MAMHDTYDSDDSAIPSGLRAFINRRMQELVGLGVLAAVAFAGLSLASWSSLDPSRNHATDQAPVNWLGYPGAAVSDELFRFFGLGCLVLLFVPLAWALRLLSHERPQGMRWAMMHWLIAALAASSFLSTLPQPETWPLAGGLGGQIGDIVSGGLLSVLSVGLKGIVAVIAVGLASLALMLHAGLKAMYLTHEEASAGLKASGGVASTSLRAASAGLLRLWQNFVEGRRARIAAKVKAQATAQRNGSTLQKARSAGAAPKARGRIEPSLLGRPEVAEDEDATDDEAESDSLPYEDDAPALEDAADEVGELVEEEEEEVVAPRKVGKPKGKPKQKAAAEFELPDLDLLSEPKRPSKQHEVSEETLEENARMLEGVLEDFGVKGQITAVHPGPVVTLYELEPAPGIKSSRVISLADDIARSMSAISARVAVVQGRNAIGIELPNAKRETVFLREMFAADSFTGATSTLALALGKNIGGDPVYADLARMPHLLIAGTTGSGKSVGINTFILSLLYRLPPDRCKLIMIDPKMLELSVYEGIPHLLAPVVTDPRKAVVALKWAVREMEDRYKKMSKVGVRNIDGYNSRINQLAAKGEKLTRTVQTGFDPESGQPTFEHEEMDATALPYIVVIIDEMADLMMVAGKDIEGAVQRLAQMARAAGIHVIMATQRPSVDVITGTIKANFPTRISFQVTSKIDSRTILGEQGAEQLLGQGDMLYMAGGGRISRLHGAFVSDAEVESIVNHLKSQGAPDYVEAVTEEPEEGEFGEGGMPGEGGGSGDALYDQAVAVVLRDKKVSTSYVQRRLQIGYNKAASLIERMEREGLISSANATGKREILVPGDSARV